MEEADIISAITFAKQKHEGQLDDSGKSCFYAHIMPVGMSIRKLTDDEDVIMAAFLHDTIEDTTATYEEIVEQFNKRVADLVMEVTHEGTNDGYGYYFPRLKSKEGILIKLMDRANNISRMEAWTEKRQEHYLKNSIFSKQFPKFGRLTVLTKVTKLKTHDKLLCRCDCGNEKVIRYDHLKTESTASCGCLQKEKVSLSNKIHGLSHSPTYSTWVNMKGRCDCPKSNSYKYYGGREISYCTRWKIFSNFLTDMGERPVNRTLDRIDNEKGYYKENCRWSTIKEQANNKRNNRVLEYNGVKKNMTEWAEEFGMEYHKFAQHLKFSNRVVDDVIVKKFWKDGSDLR